MSDKLMQAVERAKSGFFGTAWIDEIDARANAATPGDWRALPQHIEEGPDAVRCAAGWIVATTAGSNDSKFIAAARTDIPRLTTALRDSLARTKTLENTAAVLNAFIKKQRGTLSDLREILADLFKDHDDESGTIRVGDDPGCPICTVGTVPNSLNKGPCAFHRARAILRTQP